MNIIKHFKMLEDINPEIKENVILWPGTPINDVIIQQRITHYYGVPDNNTELSRPYVINKNLSKLLLNNKLKESFTVLDICCGDAIILTEIKKKFEKSIAIGIDINKNNFNNHTIAQQIGVLLYNCSLQRMISIPAPELIDCVIMLNTFRDWNSASLRSNEMNIPTLTEDWIIKNSKYAIITMIKEQIERLKRKNIKLEVIGKGELNSELVLMENSCDK